MFVSTLVYSGLIYCKNKDGKTSVETALTAQLTPAQRDIVRQLQPQATSSWWTQGHLGWTLFPVDSDQLEVRSRV